MGSTKLRTRDVHNSARRSRSDDAARASPFEFSVFLSQKQLGVSEAWRPGRLLPFVYRLRDVDSVPRDGNVRGTRASRSREWCDDDAPGGIRKEPSATRPVYSRVDIAYACAGHVRRFFNTSQRRRGQERYPLRETRRSSRGGSEL